MTFVRDVIEVIVRLDDTVVSIDRDTTTLDWAPGHPLEIPEAPGTWTHQTIGLADVFVVRAAAEPRTLPPPKAIDRRAVGYLVLSLALHLLAWNLARTQAPPRTEVVEERKPRPVYVPRSMTQARADVDGPEADAGTHTSMKLAEPGVRGDAPVTHRITREEAIEQARSAGMLGSPGLGAEVAAAFGARDMAAGVGDARFHGASEIKDDFGEERTFEPGGGGTGWGLIASCGCMDKLPLRGRGDGYGAMQWRQREIGPVCTLSIPDAVGSGDLDKAMIRRYMQRKLEQFTYCYEKQLMVEPRLAGTVTLAFTIEPSGRVQALTSTGMSDAVGACLADIVTAIEFPRSTGSTQVNYPLNFHKSGE